LILNHLANLLLGLAERRESSQQSVSLFDRTMEGSPDEIGYGQGRIPRISVSLELTRKVKRTFFAYFHQEPKIEFFSTMTT
jgi:hypothetical protein